MKRLYVVEHRKGCGATTEEFFYFTRRIFAEQVTGYCYATKPCPVVAYERVGKKKG